MTNENDTDSFDLTPEDMRQWLRQQTAKLKLAAEERIKEATVFVRAYSSGQISTDEANRRWEQYFHKWPDILCKDVDVDERIRKEAEKIANGEKRSRG